MKSPTLHFWSALLCILVFSAPVANAQKNDSVAIADLMNLSLDELLKVKITGVSKHEEPYRETPMSVYILNREEMNRWGGRSLYEMLGRVPGYTFYHTDFYGQNGVIGRGLSSVWRYALGIELMEIEDFGHFTLSPHFFDNAEIARGSGGLMWGGTAEAGLINFNIRSDLDGTEVHLEQGNYNRQALDVLFGRQFDDAEGNFFIGFHTEKQDFQEIDNTLSVFTKDQKPTIRMNGTNPSWSLISRFKYDGFKFLLYKDHDDHVVPHPWNWNSSGELALQDSIESKNGPLHDEFESTSVRGEYHFLRGKPNVDVFLFTSYYQRRWFINGVGNLTQDKERVGFGVNYKLLDNQANINIGGEVLSRNKENCPSNNSFIATEHGVNWWADAYYPIYTDNRNIYIQTDYKLSDKYKFILGARAEHQKHNGSYDEYSFSGPRIGAIFMPTSLLTFKYLYNKTDRLPIGNEISEGGKSSNAENLYDHELICLYTLPKHIEVNTGLFYQELNNQIFKVVAGSHSGWKNGGGVKTMGIESSIKYYPHSATFLYLNGHYHHVRALKTTIEDITYPIDKFSDDRLPFVPEYAFTFGVEQEFLHFIKINGALRSIGNIAYNNIAGEETQMTRYYVDAGLQTRPFWKQRLSLAVNAINVLANDNPVPAFGEHFTNANGTIEPEGFRIFGRLTVHINREDNL